MEFQGSNHSHYREVPRWEIFMEQELRFGLDLGRILGQSWKVKGGNLDISSRVIGACFCTSLNPK